MQRMNLYLIILTLYTRCVYSDKSVHLLTDFMENIKMPTDLIAPICWSFDKKAALLKRLNGSPLTRIHFTDTFPEETKYKRKEHTMILMEEECFNFENITTQANHQSLIRAPYRWFVLLNSYTDYINETHIGQRMNYFKNIGPDAEITVAQPNFNGFYLFMVYKLAVNSSILIENFGSWSIDKGLLIESEMLKPSAMRRLDLKGTPIKVTTVVTNNDSIIHLVDYLFENVDTITKSSYKVSCFLMDFLNATRVDLFTETWGYYINGSWTGMIGQMIYSNAEFGTTPMFITPNRYPLVEYISCPTKANFYFVFRQPKLSYCNNLFMLPFNATVWTCTAVTVVILAFFLFIAALWEGRINRDSFRESYIGILQAKWSDITIFIFGAICQQGSPVELKGSLGRIVIFVLVLTFMFLYISYAANIVALMQSSSNHIKTLEDLLNTGMKMSAEDTIYNHFYIPRLSKPIQKAVYQKRLVNSSGMNNFITIEQGVRNVRKGLFAFFMETGFGYKVVNKIFEENEKCDLSEISYANFMDPYQVSKKKSPYKEMFRIGLARTIEAGLQSRENRYYYASKPRCSGRSNVFISVSLTDCYPALLIICYGTILSLMIFVIEQLLYYRNKKIYSKFKYQM